MPSAEAASSYAEHGYLVVRDALPRAEIEPVLAEATRICRGELGPLEGLEPVSERDPDDAVLRRYIACHVAHKVSPRLRRLLHDERLVDVTRELIGPNVKCVHSVLFIKSPGEPGNAWHQDEFFIPSRDRSITTAWVALDDVTVENGCLHVIPGSHRAGVLYPMRRHHDPDLDRAEEAYGFPYSPEDGVAIELEAGSVVFFNGYLLHGSYPNRSASRFRRSVQFVYMSAESLLPWDQVSRGPTTRDYRDIVMVSGTDPYAYKGVADIGRAYLRKGGPTKADLAEAAEHVEWHAS